ncbi:MULTISPECIES: Stk1 family PASTA domain-containing Ser/Thr kinase [Brevibacterium]|jgi:beta-lactam-binding protein with PASTA domain/predicted Ser/Thr protein kinase|uniref:non-specific serine/threonine protein kinase n=1 Tax=Brevibacterium salitolerans TaxID=1403566 RepID=A0ABN2WMB1_9MICO|nr:Stk1 family PASTA domain-containing Ser/Thr kinase [Brevibacterium sp.]
MSDIRMLSNRYEVRRLIGRGGMAEVHEGVDTRLGRRVAIKLLRSDLARDPSFHIRLEREAKSAASLNHPGIVAVYDSGEEKYTETGGSEITVPFIVMEYVEGQTLRQVLGEHGPLSVTEALDVAAGVLAPLEYSHRHGIVHRDIKPANVMLTPEGDIKVMDFGIARALEDTGSLTQTQSVVGTAQYLSPEQARGEVVDARSDLYSTACLLYELLTGRPPFVGESQLAVAYQHVGEQPAPPSSLVPGLPRDVDRVVLHALTKDRDERYQDAHTFREDALAARDGRPLTLDGDAAATQVMGAAPWTSAEPTVAFPAAPPPTGAMAAAPGPHTEMLGQIEEGQDEDRKKSKTWIWVGSALLAIVLAGLGLWIYAMNREPEIVTFELADVTDMEANEAEAQLEGLGLHVTRDEQPDDEIDEGNVVSTDPAAGTQVEEGSDVTMIVSTGPDSIEVPDVEGDTESLARQTLGDAGLTAGSNIEQDSPDIPGGQVMETKPEAGTSVPKGSNVDLVLSSGRVEVPDVTGLSEADACSRLESDDYQLSCSVEKVETNDETAGEVFEQNAPAGTKVDQHSSVTIKVAEEEPTQEPTFDPPFTVNPPNPSPDDEDDADNQGTGPGFGNGNGHGNGNGRGNGFRDSADAFGGLREFASRLWDSSASALR